MQKVLFVGAHCDDIELGCGGLIAKLALAKRRTKDFAAKLVGFAVLSRTTLAGDMMVNICDQALWTLHKQASSADRPPTHFYDMLPSQFHTDTQAVYRYVKSSLDRLKPTIVFTHEPDMHQDHAAVFEATVRAAERSTTIITYRSSSVSCPHFQPNMYAPLTDVHVSTKLRAIQLYRDEFYGTRPYIQEDHVRAQMLVDGTSCGAAYAEAFRMYRGTFDQLCFW